MKANYTQQSYRIIKPRAYKPGRRVKKSEPMFNKDCNYGVIINGYVAYFVPGGQLTIDGNLMMMKAPFLGIRSFRFNGTPDDAKREALLVEHDIAVDKIVKTGKFDLDFAIPTEGVHIINMESTFQPPSYKKAAKRATKKIEKAIGGKIPNGFLEEFYLKIQTAITKIIDAQLMMDNLEAESEKFNKFK